MYHRDRGLARMGHTGVRAYRRADWAPGRIRVDCILAIVGVAAVLFAAQPAVAATCADELQQLADQWNALSFQTPPKPSAHVLGKNGRDYTGGQIEYMKTEIRFAHKDCRGGNNDEALRRVTIVRGILKNGYAIH